MNRRKFLAFLAATPLAAVLPLPKTEPTRSWTAVKSPEILIHRSAENDDIVRVLMEQGEEFGRSFRHTRDFHAAEIFKTGDQVSINDAGMAVPVSEENPNIIGRAMSDQDRDWRRQRKNPDGSL
jgi:hypothetical protein